MTVIKRFEEQSPFYFGYIIFWIHVSFVLLLSPLTACSELNISIYHLYNDLTMEVMEDKIHSPPSV